MKVQLEESIPVEADDAMTMVEILFVIEEKRTQCGCSCKDEL
jgi:hypothetical protein